MITDNVELSYNKFMSVLIKGDKFNIFKEKMNKLIIKELHFDIYNLNEIIHSSSNEKSNQYRDEMFKNLFESLYLIVIGKYIPSMHLLRSVLEVYAKMQNLEVNNNVSRKFSENIDQFVKVKKEGNKRNKKKLVNTKEVVKKIYGELCEYVHTGDSLEIKPFSFMQEIFTPVPTCEDTEIYIKKVNEAIKAIIRLDLMAFIKLQNNNLPSSVLFDFKQRYLNDEELEYVNVLLKNN